ncbi:TorF family putative porin [Sphingomonas abaci]|uniref:Porin domain-containing protein n=1 Tax=Sphingomonas abaci TaxID=237611 RepID=A0A7W7AL56_9SPHN|nr:TorF family putative porin [Sphingomonas abaci]MBB4619059.1 hypothetical protein [Sphingomonas abaci]
MMRWTMIAGVALLALPRMAAAQGAITDPPHAGPRLQAGVAVATDERRRGLSWSGGRAVIAGEAAATIGAVTGAARITALRGGARADGADAVADLSLTGGIDAGGFRIEAGGVAHLFGGARTRMDYGELTLAARYAFGPAQFEAGIDYAPDQAAIGGDNAYVHAGATAGIPGTPWTVLAGAGRSFGGSGDPRADRLRPGGDYGDWRIGVEHVRGPLVLGLTYTGTDLSDDRLPSRFADRANSGDRLTASARLGF